MTGLIALVLNLLSIAIGRGSFSHFMVVLTLIFYVGLPAISVLFLCLGFKHLSPLSTHVARIAFGTLNVCLSTVISIPFGAMLMEYDIQNAKQFCEQIVPRLEEFKAIHGTYPEDLSDVLANGGRPRILQGREFYFSKGTTYSFSFMNPGGMMEGFAFDNSKRQWEAWD